MQNANVDNTDWLRVFVLVDGKPGPPASLRYTQLFEIHNGSRTELDGPNLGITVGSDDELNTGNPATATNFILDVKAIVGEPAEYYFVFWNHGDGWYKSKAPDRIAGSLTKGVCYDQTSGDDYLSTNEIGTGLAGQGLTLVGFDACLEAMVEVAYEIRNDASVMVASEELEPGDGWDYFNLLVDFQAEVSPTPERFGQIAVDTYMDSYAGVFDDVMLSSIDLTRLDALLLVIRITSTDSTLIPVTSAPMRYSPSYGETSQKHPVGSGQVPYAGSICRSLGSQEGPEHGCDDRDCHVTWSHR